MRAPTISASAYARVVDPGGTVMLMAMAGGVTLSVCVPPVIVVAGVEKHGDVAFGHTCKIHFEPIGEIVALSGTLCEYAPEPFRKPAMTLFSAPPVHVYGPVGNCGLGTNWN